MNTNRPGFSLIETIAAMVIIAIAFLALATVFVNLIPQMDKIETLNKKIYLAQRKLEEYMGRSYSQAIPSLPAPLSFETGSFSGCFSDYHYVVGCFSAEATDGFFTSTYNPLDGTFRTSEYKLAVAEVWRGNESSGHIILYGLIASYEVK
jgi:prepilin-type N-terminal cleavage/methylation domain-containing protein